MVVNGVGVSFLEAGDSLVLRQKIGEAFLQSCLVRVLLGQDSAELNRVEHGYLALAPPAPQHPHGWYLRRQAMYRSLEYMYIQ
jgi:hypothetical protein